MAEFLDHSPKVAVKCAQENVLRCAIWHHLFNLKNVKSTHGGVLILVKLQASVLIYDPKVNMAIVMCWAP